MGGRPFSGSMRRSGFESGCNDDIIKRKIIHKEKRDDGKRQKDDYAAIATPFFLLITPSPMSQRNPGQCISGSLRFLHKSAELWPFRAKKSTCRERGDDYCPSAMHRGISQ